MNDKNNVEKIQIVRRNGLKESKTTNCEEK
jgi:hypothetical protein